MKEELKDLLRERARDGRLSCAEAMGIARELGVPRKEVGQAANELSIKITDCQLGCF